MSAGRLKLDLLAAGSVAKAFEVQDAAPPRFSGENFARNLELVERVKQLAAGKAATPSQLAIAWVLAQGDDVVASPRDQAAPLPGGERRRPRGRAHRRGSGRHRGGHAPRVGRPGRATPPSTWPTSTPDDGPATARAGGPRGRGTTYDTGPGRSGGPCRCFCSSPPWPWSPAAPANPEPDGATRLRPPVARRRRGPPERRHDPRRRRGRAGLRRRRLALGRLLAHGSRDYQHFSSTGR